MPAQRDRIKEMKGESDIQSYVRKDNIIIILPSNTYASDSRKREGERDGREIF